MADAILGGGDAARNNYSDLLTSSALPVLSAQLPGLISYPLVSPDDQVRILAAIDETGSAQMGDLIACLDGHAHPAAAVLELVAAGALTIEPGLIDAQTEVRRAAELGANRSSNMAAGGGGGNKRSQRVRQLRLNHFEPRIFFASGSLRTEFGRQPELNQIGIYGAVWRDQAYVGFSRTVGRRIARGEHLNFPVPPDLIFAVLDKSNRLTETQARVAERLLAQLILADEDKTLRNSLPAGDRVDPEDFDRLVLFVDEVALALRQAGLLFTKTSSSNDLAEEPEPKSKDFAIYPPALNGDDVFELKACGVTARARLTDGRWFVLTGSQVRAEVQPSAGSSAMQRRVELLHSRELVPADGHLLLRKDLEFKTASGAAHFVLGSKVKADIWTPLVPEAAPTAPRH